MTKVSDEDIFRLIGKKARTAHPATAAAIDYAQDEILAIVRSALLLQATVGRGSPDTRQEGE